MTDASLVSIIIPVHDGQATIGSAIASALEGSHRDVQVIVCDDASTDRTVDAVLAIDDPRITLLRNSTNLGPGLSRDRAIDASRGRWITFLDADDAWTSRRLENMIEAIRDDNDVMVFDDIMLCHQNRRGMRAWRRVHGASAFGAINEESVDVEPSIWAAASQFVMQPLIHAATLRASGIRHSGRRFQEDTEFFLRLIAAGLKLRYVPHAGYLYRITPGSLSAASNPGSRTRGMLEEVLPLFADDPGMLQALGKKIAYRYFTEALGSADIRSLVRIAASNPGFVSELGRRTISGIRYQASRISHGAARR